MRVPRKSTLKNWLRAQVHARSPATASDGITIDGIPVEVVRKRIKHFYLRIDRRHGHVRLSAPRNASDDELRLIVQRRIGWIERQRARVAAAPPQTPLRYTTGETHAFLGEPLRLEIVEHAGRGSVAVRTASTLELHLRHRSRLDERERTLYEWYRRELKLLIPPLVEKWQPLIDVRVANWGVKRMRTRWGTCNFRARRIWLNLELARFSVECLEYVVVHEMVHLLERYHNARFKALMTRFLPDWRDRQRTLGGRLAGHYKQGDGDDDQIDSCD